MARLYANENFSRLVVVELRRLGHDVLTTQEAGMGGRGIDDPTVLAFAVKEQRILLTVNRKHFFKLHAASALHEGIVACTYDSDVAGQAVRIDAALSTHAPMKGKLIRVNRPQK